MYHKLKKYKDEKRRHFHNFDIARFSYWDGVIVFNELKIGTQLRLERKAGYSDIFDIRINRVSPEE